MFLNPVIETNQIIPYTFPVTAWKIELCHLRFLDRESIIMFTLQLGKLRHTYQDNQKANSKQRLQWLPSKVGEVEVTQKLFLTTQGPHIYSAQWKIIVIAKLLLMMGCAMFLRNRRRKMVKCQKELSWKFFFMCIWLIEKKREEEERIRGQQPQH